MRVLSPRSAAFFAVHSREGVVIEKPKPLQLQYPVRIALGLGRRFLFARHYREQNCFSRLSA